MNIENLKLQFPKFKINNASQRNGDQIARITSICCADKNIIVVIERNLINNSYFEIIEMVEKIKKGKIKYLFLNEDNYYHTESLKTSFILHLKRILNKEKECPICYEQDLTKYLYCSQCGILCCVPCFSKSNNKSCSMCRCNTFTPFGFDM